MPLSALRHHNDRDPELAFGHRQVGLQRGRVVAEAYGVVHEADQGLAVGVGAVALLVLGQMLQDLFLIQPLAGPLRVIFTSTATRSRLSTKSMRVDLPP